MKIYKCKQLNNKAMTIIKLTGLLTADVLHPSFEQHETVPLEYPNVDKEQVPFMHPLTERLPSKVL